MPTYSYCCDACGHEFDLFQKMSADPVKECPKCNQLFARRKIGGGGGFLFKGSGFYVTDYRSDTYKEKAKQEATPASNEKAKPEASPCNGCPSGKDCPNKVA